MSKPHGVSKGRRDYENHFLSEEARTRYQNKILESLKSSDPKSVDERGRNALMRLLEDDISIAILRRELGEAERGERGLSGKITKYVLWKGQEFYENEDSEKYREYMDVHYQWIKAGGESSGIPAPGIAMRRHFEVDADALEKYKTDLLARISQEKSKMLAVVVPAIIAAGVDISATDHSGQTALMIHYEFGNVEVVKSMLENGANEFDLKLRNPKYQYLRNQEDERNISKEGGLWRSIAEVMIRCIENRDRGEYPFIQKNSDGSVSFFLSDDTSRPKDLYDPEEIFREAMASEHVTEQLKYQAHLHNFKAIGGRDLLETVRHEDTELTEYKFNLSPENLDSILMLNPQYVGYRGGNGLLKLTKSFVMKDDAIRLFPAVISDGKIFPQVAGCQVSEIPTVQLLHLLPNYESEILPRHREKGDYFHWIPGEVGQDLCLDRINLPKILSSVFSTNGISLEWEGDEGIKNITTTDPSKLHSIAVVEMDEATKDFYAMYGNLPAEQLGSCMSVEIKTSALLSAIADHLGAMGDAENVKNARNVIEKMLVKAREQEKKSEVPSVTPEVRAVGDVGGKSNARVIL